MSFLGHSFILRVVKGEILGSQKIIQNKCQRFVEANNHQHVLFKLFKMNTKGMTIE